MLNAMTKSRVMRKKLAGFCLLVWIALPLPTLAGPSAVEPAAAASYVQTLAEKVIQTLGTSATDGGKARHLAMLETMLRENLYLQRITRIMAGDGWQKMTPAQQDQFKQLVADYITLKYAFFLSGYQGESFRISSSEPEGSRDALVGTSLSRNGQPWAQVEWRITGGADRLYILDVKIEGVSLIRTEQSQMLSILQQDGVQGLLDGLAKQVALLRQKAAEA